MEIMDVNTEDSVTAPQNSDFREHSRNLLESAAGEAQERVSEQRSVKQALNSKLHSNASEYREHSQKSRNSGKPTDVETPRKLVKRTFSRDTHLQHSESREHSQNSRIKQAGIVEVTVSAEDTKCTAASSDFPEDSPNSLPSGEREMDNGEAKVSFGDRDGQCLATVSEFRELSPNSRVERKVQKAHRRNNTQSLCALASPANIRRIR